MGNVIISSYNRKGKRHGIIMIDPVKYDMLEIYEAQEVENLIKGVFYQYIAYDYSEQGVQDFLTYINNEQIVRRLLGENHKICLAKTHHEIVGVIETRNDSHITLLFVQKDFQRRGIAKGLIERVFEGHVGDMTVNASPYGAPIYEKMGFTKIAGELIKNGITYIPMIKDMKI